jgi:protein-S-isoprenylcysteine O-methyltransferase Ste14
VKLSKRSRIFGVGPIGVFTSVLLLGLCLWADRVAGHPHMFAHGGAGKAVGLALVLLGIGLYASTVLALQAWWGRNQLCVAGPFRWFRHPMYASLITFMAPGLALYRNSWILVLWCVLLHPLWHRLVIKEEKMMQDCFGDQYRAYASRTGRFVPRLRITQSVQS